MIENRTKRRRMVRQCRAVRSAFGHALGLMFKPPLRDSGLVLCFADERRRSIHMWFVFFPIDVLFLDRHKRIVELKRLTPFSVYIPQRKAQYVVELPVGSIAKGKCRIGDRVSFKCD